MQCLYVTSAILALALSACASGAGGDDPSPSTAAVGSVAPSLPGGDQLSTRPAPPESLAGTVTGTLGFAEIETGCPYLEAADGTRYEVIYPDGWELQRSPLQLVAPDGTTVARAGDEVTVRGSVAGDMASVCQIGPIFRATDVVVSE